VTIAQRRERDFRANRRKDLKDLAGSGKGVLVRTMCPIPSRQVLPVALFGQFGLQHLVNGRIVAHFADKREEIL
jgi:hypothetical protein